MQGKEVQIFRRPATVIVTRTAECHCCDENTMGRRGCQDDRKPGDLVDGETL